MKLVRTQPPRLISKLIGKQYELPWRLRLLISEVGLHVLFDWPIFDILRDQIRNSSHLVEHIVEAVE